MSWVITGSEKTPLDQDYRNVSLLLHGNGTNGSTTITDSSTSPKTVAVVGNAQISTAQSKFGGSSIAFDGNGDNLTFTEISLLNDLTVEMWIYPGNTQDSMLLSASNENHQLRLNSPSAGDILVYENSGVTLTFAAGIVANQWQHIALARSGSSTRLFVNGIQKGSTFTTFTGVYRLATAGRFRISGSYQNYDFNGYIDDLRITAGVCRYTANFTPPTAPFPDAGPAQ